MQGKNRRPVIIGLISLLAFSATFILVIKALTSGYYVWVIDQGEKLDETYLVKMCPNGNRQVLVQFGQSGAIGIDPREGFVWTTELNTRESIFADQLVKISNDWSIIQRFTGFRTSVLAVDPNDGSIWVGLPNENEVVKLDSQGNFLVAVGGFSGPASIVVDPNDSSVWIADYYPPAAIIHLTSDGDELFRVNTDGFYSNAPHQLSLDEKTGDLWLVSGNSVYRLSAQGALNFFAGGFDRPLSISVHQKDGSVWVADSLVDGSGAIVKLSSQGELVAKMVTETTARLVSVDPFGDSVWIGVDGGLFKMTNEGEIILEVKSISQPYSIGFLSIDRDYWRRMEFFIQCRTGRTEDILSEQQ